MSDATTREAFARSAELGYSVEMGTVLAELKEFTSHPHHAVLAQIMLGDTGLSSAGFPVISEESFRLFLDHVPHLFTAGRALLDWLYKIAAALNTEKRDDSAGVGQLRALRVLETVVQTAAITAPTDLWLMHHVLSGWHGAGLTERLARGEPLVMTKLAKEGLAPAQLRMDAHFLLSRGVLVASGDDTYRLAATPQAMSVANQLPPLDPAWPVDWIPMLKASFSGTALSRADAALLEAFLTLPDAPTLAPSWQPGAHEVIIGHRIVPIVLAYRNAAPETRNVFSPGVRRVLTAAGMTDEGGAFTALGDRVILRGPGPFGIIHAYHPYMQNHATLLHGKSQTSWVSRGENVAASQDANRKTFTMINDALDQFIKQQNFPLRVFIEHAVGQGEAIRQRFERSGDATIQYCGADLEDAAIDRAAAAQQRGELPRNLRFIRKADIGDPAYLLRNLKAHGIAPKGAVMVVGNGFHEVRGQTNEKMIEVFRGYNDAGIVLIFTEESGLSDGDLLATAWNTYHAGFRYVHELSGQGLRPVYDYDAETERFSWRRCVEAGGYQVHPGYSSHTRKIYPFPRPGGYNPAISVNYFCIPAWLAASVRQNSP